MKVKYIDRWLKRHADKGEEVRMSILIPLNEEDRPDCSSVSMSGELKTVPGWPVDYYELRCRGNAGLYCYFRLEHVKEIDITCKRPCLYFGMYMKVKK